MVLLEGSLIWGCETSSSCGMAACHVAATILYFILKPTLGNNCISCHRKTLCKKHITSILPPILQFEDFNQEKYKTFVALQLANSLNFAVNVDQALRSQAYH